MSAERVLAVAAKEVGYRERPGNRSKYGAAYGLDGYSWCVMFLWWCFREAGESRAFFGGGKTASCGTLLRWYTGMGKSQEPGAVQPGDIVILNFNGTKDTEHCGLVTAVRPGGVVETIEGNTGDGSQNDGDCVARKLRHLSQIVGVCRPEYAPEPELDNTPADWAREAVQWAVESGLLKGNEHGDLMLHDPVTREQMVVLLWRLREMM